MFYLIYHRPLYDSKLSHFQLAMLASLWQPAAYIVVCLIGTVNLTLSWLFLPDTKGIDLTLVKVKLHHEEENQEEGLLKEGEKKVII